MDEARAREICKATDLSGYTHEELRQADQWVKQYALDKLNQQLIIKAWDNTMHEYVMLMANHHFGSVETDALLITYECYPEWLHREQG